MRFLIAVIVITLMGQVIHAASSDAQLLNRPVWAFCKADIAKGYPDRTPLVKPILVKVVGINIKDRLLLVTSDQLLLRLGAKNKLNIKSFSDCDPLIKVGE